MAGNKSSGNKEQRTRNWTFVLYEDSSPGNWADLLDAEHIEWIESPWHDRDVNPDGETKKKHKHILLLFGGVKSYEQVKEITDKLCSPIPQRCHNAKSMVRYMAHLDNPEKAQYSPSDIIPHGGVDLAELLRPSTSERYSLIIEMGFFIRDNDITEFEDLFFYAAEYRRDDWFPLIADNSTYVLNALIKSHKFRSDRGVSHEKIPKKE